MPDMRLHFASPLNQQHFCFTSILVFGELEVGQHHVCKWCPAPMAAANPILLQLEMNEHHVMKQCPPPVAARCLVVVASVRKCASYLTGEYNADSSGAERQ